jgi:Cu-Zn family superoxide dismutase
MAVLSTRTAWLALPVFLGLTMVAGQPAAQSQEQGTAATGARASVRNVNGGELAAVRLTQLSNGKVAVSLRARGLTPGLHGFHVHTTGICDPNATDPATGQRSPFFTAGGHYNPRNVPHGQHAGDLPLLFAGSDGTAAADTLTDRFTVSELLAGDGSAVIIHAMADNVAHIPDRYTHQADATGTTGPDAATQATGDAGGRTTCGVVRAG